jgi:hypothetical protein
VIFVPRVAVKDDSPRPCVSARLLRISPFSGVFAISAVSASFVFQKDFAGTAKRLLKNRWDYGIYRIPRTRTRSCKSCDPVYWNCFIILRKIIARRRRAAERNRLDILGACLWASSEPQELLLFTAEAQRRTISASRRPGAEPRRSTRYGGGQNCLPITRHLIL